jgi:acyl-CoA synthetase (AMP-forming)/AMP-acid ligase II
LYGSAFAGVPFVPVNYRLAGPALRAILQRIAPSLVVVDDELIGELGQVEGVALLSTSAFLAALNSVTDQITESAGTPDDIAIMLFTSGTTGQPKAALLRHTHLAAYVLGTVEFMGADDDEAALVGVPPYHVAGMSAAITSVFAGRRVVYLPNFEPENWLEIVQREGITQAMVVPTMFGRIVDAVERLGTFPPGLRHLSYGGGRMPLPVIQRALALMPQVAFVNAYGLTETSSTIAVLTPDDHRQAFASADPAVRDRLGSVGRPLPSIELEIRDGLGEPVAAGERGEIWVRGDQVAGEYMGQRPTMVDGWFPTRDEGALVDEYLYVYGRLDDVIVRGGENISPGEIEEVLVQHPHVREAAVFGLPDQEWGEVVAAAVVRRKADDGTEAVSIDELESWVRAALRSSKVPGRWFFPQELPYNETGKLLRRVLKNEFL